MKRLIVAALLAVAAVSWGAALRAQQGVPAPAVQDYQGVPYLTGGIGETERAAILAAAADFNLKLLFAEKGGAYLADIAVLVRDADGKTALELKADGPLVLARLPAGDYRIAATANGREQVRSARIPATGQHSIVFYW
jgi:hypothetical protein